MFLKLVQLFATLCSMCMYGIFYCMSVHLSDDHNASDLLS